MKLQSPEEREFPRRVLGIALGAPPFLVLLLLNRWTLAGVFMVLSLLAFREYWTMMGQGKSTFAFWFCCYPLALIYLFLLFPHFLLHLVAWYLFFLALMVWSLTTPSQVLERSGLYLWGCVYCLLFPFFWVKTGLEYSRWLVLFFVLLVWANDIFAYLVGKKWGHHKIAPQISPKKSWEGLGGGIAATVALSMILGYRWFRISPSLGFFAGLSIALVAFLGDLFESALKRKMGLKDSGRFLPGHGGILDRFDAFFAAGPLVYLLGTLLGRG